MIFIIYIYMSILTMFLLLYIYIYIYIYTYCTILPNKSNQKKDRVHSIGLNTLHVVGILEKKCL